MKRGRKLGRNATHRQALLKSLACRLFEHERIITTLAKAKELRPYAEKLITVAKKALVVATGAANFREAKKLAAYEPQYALRTRGEAKKTKVAA